jgi:phosphoserine aminotransferase
VLRDAFLGRSHRNAEGKARLKDVIDRSGRLLGLPVGWRIGMVPASDTGAIEMALWSLLGARGVDVLVWENFGANWRTDIEKHLKIEDVRIIEAGYGDLPDLAQVDCDRDVVFTWNGTTSGVKVPNGDWIAADRAGLTICDATSAAFAMDLPWEKLDVVTYSWQKVMGGEAQHGMIVLSPRAIERLESYTPPWPLPKLFRLTKDGKLSNDVFEGLTINTPSMLVVEDARDGLAWADSIGGLAALIGRTNDNYAVLRDWVEVTPWIDFLAADPATRSTTSVCLQIVDPWFLALDGGGRAAVTGQLIDRLAEEGVAYDIKAYRTAPPGLRIWTGATIERSDVEALCPWLDWVFQAIKAETAAAA